MKEIMKERNLRKCIIILAWILVWHIAAVAVDNRILLVTPLQAFGELLSMLGDPRFYRTVGLSLLRIGSGFLAGFAAAVVLAALCSRHALLEEAFSPVMTLLKAVPVASFVVLLLIWWGSSFLAVAICFVVVLPNIYVNTLEGIKNTDRQLLEMAQVFRLSAKNKFFYIYRPAIAPFLYSSMKVSLGMCWKSGVAAEVIGTPDDSIGEGLYLSKIYLDTAGVFAWTAIIILLSILFEKLVLWLTDRFFQWQPVCGRPAVKERTPEAASGQTAWEKAPGKTAGEKAPGKTAWEKAPGKTAWEKASGKTAWEKASGQTAWEKAPGKTVRKRTGGSVGRLEVEHVCKSFGSQQVLSDFSAVYEAGQTYILNGPSGSGKTTLLNILAGILKPDSGAVKGGGTCSMVFQEDRLCLDYSAVKNVELATGNPVQARQMLAELLDPGALDKPCRELSGGMKRRVALVRAMEAESEYVLLDEPFTGMDADTRAQAEAYIRKKQKGRMIVLVTHIPVGISK